jgi:hypothetical protein
VLKNGCSKTIDSFAPAPAAKRIRIHPPRWWREINDILRVQGFNWVANGKDSSWIKIPTKS